MKKPFEVRIEGERWQIHKQTRNTIVLVRATQGLAAWRLKNSLSQRAAAKKLGISQAHLAKIELGQRFCPPAVLERIKS